VAHELFGHRADQDLPAAGSLLEPFRGVDGVAGNEGRGVVPGHHLAGVDPDSGAECRDVSLGKRNVQPLHRFLHRERRSDRA
jgi:hypothetical protein